MPIKHPRVRITKTEGEWKEIEKRLKDAKRPDLTKYLNTEIRKLAKKFKECPNCVTPASGDRTERQFCVSKETYQVLQSIADRIQRPVSSIIDDFFISPIITPE